MQKKLYLVFRLVFLGMLCATCGSLTLLAQSNRGTIAGTVVDSTGAVIPNVELTATDAQTGAIYKTVSSSSGTYRFADVALGVYNVTASAPGFQPVKESGVVVQINSTSALNIQLQAGGASQTVTVSANAPTVQTETSEIGAVVDTKQIIDLPLSLGGQGVLRSPEAFVFLTPGTTGPGSGDSNNGVFEAKLAGGQNFGNEVILDGASTSRADSGSSFDQTAPSVEALQEFKITTSTIPAEYGRTSGGVESFATKSGTNVFHGSAYDIFKNDALDANTWFNNLDLSLNPANRSLFQTPVDKKNDYGGSVGGPVWIPKLYNGRNKTFFFFSWEQYRQNQGGVTQNTVPTAAERGGDFSDRLGSPLVNGNGQPVINPCTGQQIISGQIFDPATSKLVGGVQCRSPFAGNVIPTGRFSSVAQNLLKLVPAPNSPGLINNYAYAVTSPVLSTTMTVRIDQNLSAKGKLFFSYSSRDNDNRNGLPGLPDPIANNGFFSDFFTHYVRVGYDYVITPAILNHLNIGYNRVNSNSVSGAAKAGVDWDANLGIKNASGPTFPQFNFNGPEKYTAYGNANADDDVINALIAADSVVWQAGRHTFTFGVDWRNSQFSVIDQSHQSPGLNFSTNQTAVLANDSGRTGNTYASLLLNQVDGYNLAVRSSQPRFVNNYYAGFVQDDYKVSNDLMLNLGLRYSVETPRHESHGNVSEFSPTAVNPGATGVLGALVFAGNGTGRFGTSGSFAKTWKKDFAPRVGFSYAPSSLHGNTAIRGGFGIYYAGLTYADFGQSLTDGFTASPSGSETDGFSPEILLDSGIPTYPAPPNLDPAQDNGSSGGSFGGITYVAPSYGRPGMVENWSMQVQQQLAPDLILNIGYVGQHSTHLRSNLAQINNLNPKYFGMGNTLNQAINSPEAVTAGVAPPFPQFETLYKPGTVGQALRPFPQYQSIDTDCCLENLGQASYNAMLVSLQRRFRNGFNLLASYTWEKTETDADSALPFFNAGGSVQNSYNLKGEKSISSQDIPQTFVLSYLYELPFGPGKTWLKHGVASYVAGGWELGGVQRYESGQPTIFGCATGVPAFSGCIRFNQVPNVPLANPVKPRGPYNPRTYSIFNGIQNPLGSSGSPTPSTGINGAFQDPNFLVSSTPGASYGFGDLPRVTGAIRTAHYDQEDFSLLKNMPIFRGQTLIFEAEAFNAFNRHVFSRPDAGPFDTNFGGRTGTVDSPRQLQLTLRYQF